MGEQVKVDGLKELLANMKTLHEDLQNRAGRAAVSAAAGLVAREAKKKVDALGLVKTGALRENIAIRRVKTPADRFEYEVLVRNGKRKKGSKAKRGEKLVFYNGTKKRVKYINDPYYWWWLEFGTSKMPAKPFMRPAFEANVTNAQNRMVEQLRKTIEKFKAKYGS
ncbi:MAG TPA: HK97-gp10 family putative phage morphogenesis protein [Limnobacter sp.]|uniref:HK97-gp10 family putative phage morphogenesis protein n=1 Tax=Limnobacter sp. TaxID=2003368 RepID=UPI002E2F3AB2|nr:HK97-gp10 family putative phage morphogenesis protein [Limnobacter sp.]HEX5486500.1 HK97-gp10 family putative phage morphogenesis protein [Limnobacter sp.]